MKIVWIDTETTGTDYRIHGLTQVAGIVEVDGVEVERFDIKLRPGSMKAIDAQALALTGLAIADLDAEDRLSAADGWLDFIKILERNIDRYDKKDKAFLVGYNVRFDEEFLRQWFKDSGDPYFGTWFWTPCIDVMTAAATTMSRIRPTMADFKLGTVAKTLGLAPAGDLHNAMTDIELTRDVMRLLVPEFGKEQA